MPAFFGTPESHGDQDITVVLRDLKGTENSARSRTACRRSDASWSCGRCVLAVEDAGVGIAAADMARVFDAFYTTKPSGIGMGLSISRSIIERHGGRLSAMRNPQYGATFAFVLTGRSNE